MIPPLTNRMETAIALAQNHARHHGREEVLPQDVLLGLIDEGGNVALNVLRNVDVNVPALRAALSERAPSHPRSRPWAVALEEFVADPPPCFADRYVGSEHALHVIVREGGVAVRAMREAGATADAVLAELYRLLGRDGPDPNAGQRGQAGG